MPKAITQGDISHLFEPQTQPLSEAQTGFVNALDTAMRDSARRGVHRPERERIPGAPAGIRTSCWR